MAYNYHNERPLSAFVPSFSVSSKPSLTSSSFTCNFPSKAQSARRPHNARSPPMSTAAVPVEVNSDIKRLASGTTIFNKVVYTNAVTAASGGDQASQTAAIFSDIESQLSSSGSDKSRVLTVSANLSSSASADALNSSLSSWLSDMNTLPPTSVSSSAFLPNGALLSIQVTAAVAPPEPIIKTLDAAQAVGPYNQAIATSNGTLYVSGCIGLTADTGVMAGDTVEEQTKQALSNLTAILKAANCSPSDIVKTIVLLDDMGDFATVNEMYADFFAGGRVPARSCFAAKTLPKGALVEIEAVATIPE